MLNNFCAKISQNKNLLMLLSSGIYVLALYATLSEHLLLASFFILIFSIFILCKNLFPIKYVIIWNLLFYFGVFNLSMRLKDVDELLNLAPVNSEITGTIVSIPQGILEGKPKFFFNVDKIKYGNVEKSLKNEKILVTINSAENIQNLKLYNTCALKGRLSVPFKAGNPSQFDYGDYLRNHNAYAVFYAKEFQILDKELELKAKMIQGINDYRERVLSIHSKYLDSPYLELLGGIVFGDDAVSPSKEIKKSFANSGLLHILAASGMNVAFIYGFFFWILSIFKVGFRPKVVIGMITVIAYSLMTGLGASIIRATVMLLFVLVGKLIDRDAHSISLLSFVGLLMLIYNPFFINDVGFQLSFIVTFGILLMTPLVIRLENRVLDYLIGMVAVPVIAQLWVIPLQIFYFNNISIYSIFANIMSVPVLAVLSFGGFISSLLSVISPIADLICKNFDFILNPLLHLLVNISDFWGHLPNSTIQTTHPAPLQILIYYLILLLFTCLFNKELREKYLYKILVSLVVLISIWLLSLIPIKNSNLEITAFDVGNADCFLIKTPENEYAMIDTGKFGYKGGKSQAEVIVLKYLKDRGIKDLKILIVTHFDNDHCGGAVDILNELNVENLYVNDISHSSNAADMIMKAAKNNDTKIHLASNKQIVYDKNNFKISNLLGISSDNDNEKSIITFLEYNKFSILFTGDASASAISEILKDLPKNITVLKVPHHGALDGLNKEILAYLNPKVSLISVGENKFGHPSIYTLALLQKTNILRTDIDNSILIRVNKKGYKILSYDLKRKRYQKISESILK